MRVRLVCLAALSSLAACGYTREELTMATVHTCEMQRLEREMAAHPQERDSLLAEFQTRLRYLDIVVDLARSPESLRDAVREAACETAP